MYAYVRAMCGWLDVLRSFSSVSFVCLVFFSFYHLTGGGEGACGDVRICSIAPFVLLWVFVSSGTDCRVRRRMHAPFPGPYVSTLALNFNPTLCNTRSSRFRVVFSRARPTLAPLERRSQLARSSVSSRKIFYSFSEEFP